MADFTTSLTPKTVPFTGLPEVVNDQTDLPWGMASFCALVSVPAQSTGDLTTIRFLLPDNYVARLAHFGVQSRVDSAVLNDRTGDPHLRTWYSPTETTFDKMLEFEFPLITEAEAGSGVLGLRRVTYAFGAVVGAAGATTIRGVVKNTIPDLLFTTSAQDPQSNPSFVVSCEGNSAAATFYVVVNFNLFTIAQRNHVALHQKEPVLQSFG